MKQKAELSQFRNFRFRSSGRPLVIQRPLSTDYSTDSAEVQWKDSIRSHRPVHLAQTDFDLDELSVQPVPQSAVAAGGPSVSHMTLAARPLGDDSSTESRGEIHWACRTRPMEARIDRGTGSSNRVVDLFVLFSVLSKFFDFWFESPPSSWSVVGSPKINK